MQRTPFPEKKWSKEAFSQIKKLTKKDYLRYLRKDPNWTEVDGITFFNDSLPEPYKFVTIHYHKSKDVYESTRFIKNMLNQICWTEKILKEWRAI